MLFAHSISKIHSHLIITVYFLFFSYNFYRNCYTGVLQGITHCHKFRKIDSLRFAVLGTLSTVEELLFVPGIDDSM